MGSRSPRPDLSQRCRSRTKFQLLTGYADGYHRLRRHRNTSFEICGSHKRRCHQNVDVDAVWGTQPLSACIGQHVDYVLASHVIEHVTDVIAWLDEIRSVLNTGGTLRLAIPDRRFTFDYRRKETQLHELLNANLVKARAPLPICILDHMMNVCQLHTGRAWEGNLCEEDLKPFHDMQTALSTAINALRYGTYHDVHCWVFTPCHSPTCLNKRVGMELSTSHANSSTIQNQGSWSLLLRLAQVPTETR
ncbi:class I SAM-dependent methyltransferase [Paraburkholderia ultramafica]|uniref:methyltransferase domain-containing protein n=1 Tax=Paraburkholderia ultramafica TaxID=1544867 RepID=UPI00158271D9